jgi:hypothetical protein
MSHLLRRGSRFWIVLSLLAIAVAYLVHMYVVWRRGDDMRIPGIGIVRRFPCADYTIPPAGSDGIQAFAVIDIAAERAASDEQAAVVRLVEAVFDRELPMVRCGNPLRRRVIEAEWRFRRRGELEITEPPLADIATEVLASAAAPPWARVTSEEIRVMRTALWPEVPHLIGTVGDQLRLGSRLSQVYLQIVSRSAHRFLDRLGFPK